MTTSKTDLTDGFDKISSDSSHVQIRRKTKYSKYMVKELFKVFFLAIVLP